MIGSGPFLEELEVVFDDIPLRTILSKCRAAMVVYLDKRGMIIARLLESKSLSARPGAQLD